MFSLTCPRCKAPPDEAHLEVVSGTFNAIGMRLQEDGFATSDANQFNTDEEWVFCNACDARFPLGECMADKAEEAV